MRLVDDVDPSLRPGATSERGSDDCVHLFHQNGDSIVLPVGEGDVNRVAQRQYALPLTPLIRASEDARSRLVRSDRSANSAFMVWLTAIAPPLFQALVERSEASCYSTVCDVVLPARSDWKCRSIRSRTSSSLRPRSYAGESIGCAV